MMYRQIINILIKRGLSNKQRVITVLSGITLSGVIDQ